MNDGRGLTTLVEGDAVVGTADPGGYVHEDSVAELIVSLGSWLGEASKEGEELWSVSYCSWLFDELEHGFSGDGARVGSGIGDSDPYILSLSDIVDGPSHQYGYGTARGSAVTSQSAYGQVA